MARNRSFTLVFALLALPTAVQAERRNPLEGQPAIRHKFEMRKRRFEITPQILVSLNQDFRTFIGGGAMLQFHFADWIAIGVQGGGGGGIDTPLTDRINEKLPKTSTEGQIEPSQEQFKSHLATIAGLFSAHLTLTPFAGKMTLFGALYLRYDFYGMLGAGALFFGNSFDSSPEAKDVMCRNGNPNRCPPLNGGLQGGGMLGLGMHLFFNDFVGLNFEVRDFLVNSNVGGLDVNGDRKVGPANPGEGNADDSLGNHLFFGLGVTIMVPPTAKISP